MAIAYWHHPFRFTRRQWLGFVGAGGTLDNQPVKVPEVAARVKVSVQVQ